MAPKVVLLTGSSSGIGLAVAKRLACDPDQRFLVIATVVALSEKADLEAAVAGVLDKTIFIKELNILNDDDITRVVEEVIQTYGRVDILVNVAGILSCRVPEDMTRKEVDSLIAVNLIGPIRLTQAVLPNMKKRMGGRIVSVSSNLGKIGFPYFDVYVASKFGMEGFFESLAPSVKAFNIRVCLVEPGIIGTPIWSTYLAKTKEYYESSSLTDIDRRQLRAQFEKIAPSIPISPDVVAEALVTKCLDVENPTFRHLVAQDDIKEEIIRSVPDLTGETALAILADRLK